MSASQPTPYVELPERSGSFQISYAATRPFRWSTAAATYLFQSSMSAGRAAPFVQPHAHAGAPLRM